jgi:hypothetical protein
MHWPDVVEVFGCGGEAAADQQACSVAMAR